MNSLIELRAVFEANGIKVTDHTGYTFKADGHTWGVAFECPVRDGKSMSKADWKEYVKMLKSGSIAKTLGLGLTS
jgi:hypothetical protein